MEIENIDCFHEVRFTGRDGQPTTSTVPVVQELVRQGLQQLPKRFSRRPDVGAQPSIRGSSPPTIDMAKLNSDHDTRKEELGRLAGAMEGWGMFFVSGHGVSPDLLASLEEVIKGFFNLSFEEKKRSVGSYFNTDNLGYGRSFVQSDDQALDWIDRYAVRVQPNQDKLGLKLWPQNPACFRQVMEKYVAAVRETCDQLLQSMAESFGLQKQTFLEAFEPKPDCLVNVRVNYFPPLPGGDVTSAPHGISPHSDGSVVTVLAQFDGTEGLEVLRPEGWVRVPAPEDKLLVGAGDLLEVISNGRSQSPWHRVATRGDEERYSVAMFYYPPENAEVEPVVGGAAREVGFGYRKVVVGEYLKHYYKVNPTKVKSAVNFAKV